MEYNRTTGTARVILGSFVITNEEMKSLENNRILDYGKAMKYDRTLKEIKERNKDIPEQLVQKYEEKLDIGLNVQLFLEVVL